MKRIMIYTSKPSFVQCDINIIKCNEYHVKTNKKGYIHEFLFFLINRYDQYIIWFCDKHALIPVLFAKLFRKKVFIIAGGYDACAIPELNYGIFLKKGIRLSIIKLCYKLADKVILPSPELKDRLIENVNINSKIRVIFSAIDTEFWKPEKLDRIYDFVTIGNIKDSNTFYRKGIDKFFTFAFENPDKEFILIGNYNKDLQAPNLSNLTITGYLETNVLKFYLNKSVHYCQLSRYEAFGYALIEAMSMGCIPIVSDVGIMKFITECSKTSEEARQRIIDLFSIEQRKEKLLNLLK